MDMECLNMSKKNSTRSKKRPWKRTEPKEVGSAGAANPRVVACAKNGVSTLPRKNPELGTLCIGLYESMHTNKMTN